MHTAFDMLIIIILSILSYPLIFERLHILIILFWLSKHCYLNNNNIFLERNFLKQ